MLARGLGLVRCLNLAQTFAQPCRFKGHSKWDNIRHIKAAEDHKVAVRNHLYANRVMIAIRENGYKTDMDHNRALAKVYNEAIASGVRRVTLEKAIKNASDKNVATLQEFIVEARGPGGCMILIEVLAPNKGSMRDVNTILKKNFGILEPGVAKGFTRSASVVIESKDDLDLDKAEELAIEVGAEDVELVEDDEGNMFNFICNPHHLSGVKTSLEKAGVKVIAAESQFNPFSTVSLSGGMKRSAEKLITLLSEDRMVVGVHHNIEEL